MYPAGPQHAAGFYTADLYCPAVTVSDRYASKPAVTTCSAAGPLYLSARAIASLLRAACQCRVAT